MSVRSSGWFTAIRRRHEPLWATEAGLACSALTRYGLRPTSPEMAVRDILILPDPRLRLVSEPVEKHDLDLRQLVADMFETMYAAPGIGLAAIQIGVPKRVITLDLARKDESKRPQVYI